MSEPDTPAPREPVSTLAERLEKVRDLAAKWDDEPNTDMRTMALKSVASSLRLIIPDVAAALTRPPAVEGTREPDGYRWRDKHRSAYGVWSDWAGWHVDRWPPPALDRQDTQREVQPLFAAPSAAPTGTTCTICEGTGQVYEVTGGLSPDDGWKVCAACGGGGLTRTPQEVGKLQEEYWQAVGDLFAANELAALRVSPEGRTDAERPFGPEATDANRMGAGEVAP